MRRRLRRGRAPRTFAFALEIYEGHRALERPLEAPAVALGNFDGVHLGHHRLLSRARAAADRSGGEVVVFTFEPHPAKVLAPKLAPRLITTRARKLELLREHGVGACVLEPFDRELSQMEPDRFVEEILVRALNARHVVVGYDFTYGHQRRGDTTSLRAAGREHGFEVEVIDPVTIDGLVASSTKVRNFVTEGNMAGARLLLGRDFEVDGAVVRGAGRGREIGIPTANLAPETELVPPSGIYAVRARVLGEEGARELGGAASIGTNPTFVDSGELTLEVHLFDYDEDLYDRRLRVAFVERLRGERRYQSAEALVEQIHRDIEQAKAILRGSR